MRLSGHQLVEAYYVALLMLHSLQKVLGPLLYTKVKKVQLYNTNKVGDNRVIAVLLKHVGI